MQEGGVQTRPGTVFIAPAKYATTTARNVKLVSFIFNSSEGNTYAIEVGHLYMRFHKNGAQIRLASQAITNVTQASTGVVTYSGADTLANGDEVYLSGIVGMMELNGRWFKVANVNTGANTFELNDRDGNAVSTSGYTAYSSGGTFEEVYEITTTYDNAHVMTLSTAQLNDVVNIAHGSYAPAKLTRSSDTSWALSTIAFGPTTSRATVSGYSGTGGGAIQANYKITTIDATTKQESLSAFYVAGGGITAATRANPCEVTTSASHYLLTGDVITISGVVGMTQLNGNSYTITKVSATKFTLGVDSSAYTAWSSGGSVTASQVRTADTMTAPSPANPITLTWIAISNALQYVVYKETNGTFAFLGFAGASGIVAGTNVNFQDIGQGVDTTDTLGTNPTIFASSGNYPYCVAYGQQRLLWGGTDNNPNRISGSTTGDYYNMSYHTPSQANDAITLDLVGTRANVLRSMAVIGGKVVAFTSEGEYAIGDTNGVIDATSPDARQYSSNGSAKIQALIIDNVATYVKGRGSQVRDLGFDLQFDGYKGEARSIQSSHLLKGHTIVDWCYASVPNSQVWLVRDDGMLLGFTYVREQQMFGWWRCDFFSYIYRTSGVNHRPFAKVLSICSIPENDEDSIYVVIQRYTLGTYIERLSVRHIKNPNSSAFAMNNITQVAEFVSGGVADAVCVDSAKKYDGRNTDTDHCMRLASGQTPYDTSHSLTLQSVHADGSNFAYFAATDVGNSIFLYNNSIAPGISPFSGSQPFQSTSATMVKFTIEGYTDSHTVTGHIDRTAPSGIASNTSPPKLPLWSYAIKTMPNLWHLAGTYVSVMGDGFVEASPLNSAYSLNFVSGTDGTIIFSRAYERVSVGLPYLCDLETNDIDNVQVPGGGLITKKKSINKVWVAVQEARGLYAGAQPPADDVSNALSYLDPDQRRANDLTYDDPLTLETETHDVDTQAEYNSGGKVFIRQVDPIPACVLAIVPDGITGI